MNMNEKPQRNIVLLSVLNGATFDYEPIAAGETLELALKTLEEEKPKFTGTPFLFDMIQKTLIRFNPVSVSR